MKKFAVLILAVLLVLPLAAGGSSDKKASVTEDGRPIITMWSPINANITQVAQSFADTVYWQELQERTGVQIEFQHVSASGSALSEGFNILIASGDYPDIIQYKWIDYPGGPAAAISDGVIIPLNDIFEQYCPNITAFLEEHPDIAKMISTDDGTYYCFPFLRGESFENNPLLFSEGWVWRKDLLDKAGLDIPETPEELYQALVAFKEMGIQMPLSVRSDHISRVLAPGFDSYGDSATSSFYVVDGVVHNGYIEPNRKEYLKFAHKLYEEKLLDNDYLSVDRNKLGVNVLNGLCGAAYAPGGSGIGTWLPAMRQIDPTVELVSAKPLSPEKGRLSMFSKMNDIYDNSGSSSAITTACTNIEAVAKFLDYSYSEEGRLLDNFGIEGDTFVMIDGYPTYTDKVVPTSEDGLTSEGYTISQALSMYTRTYATGGYIQDPRYIEQYYSLPELSEAIQLWAQTDYGKYIYPPTTTTAEEASELASIMNNIQTYVDEMESKFITGMADIDKEWDGYVKQLENFGMGRAIEIKQAAYDRYMSK